VRLRRLTATLVLVVAFGIWFGCRATSERSIVGTFEAQSPCNTVTLQVSKGHTFVQSVSTSLGPAKHISGTWELKHGTVYFRPFLDFATTVEGEQRNGASFEVERGPFTTTMGPIIVKCPDSSHELDYVK
jgi:hypothetical protein